MDFLHRLILSKLKHEHSKELNCANADPQASSNTEDFDLDDVEDFTPDPAERAEDVQYAKSKDKKKNLLMRLETLSHSPAILVGLNG